MITERPLHEKERKKLRKELAQLEMRKRVDRNVLLGWILVTVAVGTFVFFRNEGEELFFLILGVCIVFILIGVWNFVESRIRRKRRIRSLDYALKMDKLKSVKVCSEKFIQLVEEDDEGVYYLFQLPGNQILSFGGQDFYPTKKFPSNDFEIACCYDKDEKLVFLKTYVFGERIRPVRTISGQEKWDMLTADNYPDPGKVVMIEGVLEDIDNLIDC